MKNILLCLAVLVPAFVGAQPDIITAKRVRATQNLQIGADSVNSIIQTITSASTHKQLPTAKAVYDFASALTFTLVTTPTLSGAGTSGSPLTIAQQGATNGQPLEWNSSLGRWAPGTDDGTTYTGGTGISVSGTVINNTGDLSTTNELVTGFSVVGNLLRLSQPGGGFDVALTSIAPDQSVTNELVTSFSISSGNLELKEGGVTRNVLLTDIAPDRDTTNEIQSLSRTGQNLNISKGGTGVLLPIINVSQGTGISVSIVGGNATVTNTGDTDATNDITNTTPATNDLSGTYPGPTVARIQGRAVATTAPTTNQVLKWNGTAWAPGTDDNSGSTYTGGTGISVVGTVISNTGDLSATNEIQRLDTFSISGNTLSVSLLNDGVPASTVTLPSGGTPGGANTQIQYNNGGTFAGSGGLIWDNANQMLALQNGSGRFRVGTNTLNFQGLYPVPSGILYNNTSDRAGLVITNSASEIVRSTALQIVATYPGKSSGINVTMNGTASINSATGDGFGIVVEGAGGGIYRQPRTVTSGTVTANAYGHWAHQYWQNTGSSLTANGGYINFGSSAQIAAGPTTINAISDYYIAPLSGANAGVVNNRYSVDIRSTASTTAGQGVTNNWGVYQTDINTNNAFNGNVLVGTLTAAIGTKLSVVGGGSTSATRSFLAENSAGTDALWALDNATVGIAGTGGTATSITGRDANNIISNVTIGSGLTFASGTLSAANLYNANGTLSAQRTVTMGGNLLIWNASAITNPDVFAIQGGSGITRAFILQNNLGSPIGHISYRDTMVTVGTYAGANARLQADAYSLELTRQGAVVIPDNTTPPASNKLGALTFNSNSNGLFLQAQTGAAGVERVATVENDLTPNDLNLITTTHTLSGKNWTSRADANAGAFTITLGAQLEEGRDYVVMCKRNGTNAVTFTAAGGYSLSHALDTALTSGNLVAGSTGTGLAAPGNTYYIRRSGTIISIK